jgi:hypothetical protein
VLFFISSAVGNIGFLLISFNFFLCLQIHTISVQIQSLVSLLNIVFTILSSKEWKLIINKIQFLSSKSIASFKDFSNVSSSLFASILNA